MTSITRSMVSRYFIGLMSGTSLDGVDAALVDLSDTPRLAARHYAAFPPSLREELLALHEAGHAELHRAALASNHLVAQYAQAVRELLSRADVAAADVVAIGCHGQTIRHRPDEGYTLQLNNPSLLTESTGIAVVADFRSRDIAAGGHGAPLVPAFHAACFRDGVRHRTIINIGGIANVTSLPPGDDGTPTGFDTGPGNMLMDAWAREHLGTDCDIDGCYATSGVVIEPLLAECMTDPYFVMAPPKSTGRDRFHREWLMAKNLKGLRPQDVQATLAELTARSITHAIARWCPQTQDAFVCGGGAHNADLMHRLKSRLQAGAKPVTLASTETLGMHPDWVEAMAFAWLAAQAVDGKTGNLASVTGARGPRVLGAIYPA